MLDLKSSLLEPKPNFDQLKDQIKSWWKQQISLQDGVKNEN